MRDDVVKNVLVLLAVLTPLVAVVVWLGGRALAKSSAAAGIASPVRRLGLKCLILGLAGPANLGLWYCFNQWLDHIGYRSVIGYVIAVVVFLAGGWLTGFLRPR